MLIGVDVHESVKYVELPLYWGVLPSACHAVHAIENWRLMMRRCQLRSAW